MRNRGRCVGGRGMLRVWMLAGHEQDKRRDTTYRFLSFLWLIPTVNQHHPDHLYEKDSPLILTLASIKPIKVVGTRMKLELRRYDAHAYPATSVHRPPPTTSRGSVLTVPNESMASTISSMVSMVLFISPPLMTFQVISTL